MSPQKHLLGAAEDEIGRAGRALARYVGRDPHPTTRAELRRLAGHTSLEALDEAIRALVAARRGIHTHLTGEMAAAQHAVDQLTAFSQETSR